MSTFLWVEDFDGPGETILQDTTRYVFGQYSGNQSKNWSDMFELREYLSTRGIFLETSLVDALDFMTDPKKFSSVDFVILDIDLRISADPEDEKGSSDLERILLWHELDGDGRKRSEVDQRSELRKIAGYHLWTRLIIDLGFPRDRIQFCSNHGPYLETMRKSFESARIEPPISFTKSEGKMEDWINQQSNDAYTALRRNVIDDCAVILEQLKADQDDSPATIRLSQFPGPSTQDFKHAQAVDMLKRLPLYLPSIVSDRSRNEVLRAFVRALTMEWDRFSVRPKIDIPAYKLRTGEAYTKAIEKPLRCGASTLKLLRNTLAHTSDTPVPIDIGQVVVYFEINMATIFYFENTSSQNKLERKLSSEKKSVKTAESLREGMLKSKESIEALANNSNIPLTWTDKDGSHNRSLGDLFRQLQDRAIPAYQQDATRQILRFLWHELIYDLDDIKFFERQFASIRQSRHPIHRAAMACVDEIF